MTATTGYNRAACEQTYRDVEQLIYHTVHRFHRRHGGDFEEQLSAARLIFMAAYNDHTAGKIHVPFHTALVNYIWYSLFDRYRTDTGHRRITPRPGVTSLATAGLDGGAYDPADYRANKAAADAGTIERILDGLSADAAICVRLVLEPTPDLEAAAESKGGTGRNWLSSLRGLLLGQGWTAERVTAAFREVAISGN